MKNLMSGRKPQRPLAVTGALSLLILLVFAAERLPASLSRQDAPARADTVEAGAKTGAASRSAAELGRKIDEAIAGSDFAAARWGVFVVSLRDGRVLYARDAQRPFTPASNM